MLQRGEYCFEICRTDVIFLSGWEISEGISVHCGRGFNPPMLRSPLREVSWISMSNSSFRGVMTLNSKLNYVFHRFQDRDMNTRASESRDVGGDGARGRLGRARLVESGRGMWLAVTSLCGPRPWMGGWCGHNLLRTQGPSYLL